MSQSKKRRKSELCPNCSAELPSPHNFCQICGQENHDLKVPFSHLVAEVIEGFFHLDTKLVTTLKVMLIRPGQVTKDFVEGRRARYVPPMRVYFFMSFVFFLLANQLSDKAFESEDGSGLIKINVDKQGKKLKGIKISTEDWSVADAADRMDDLGIENTDSLKGVYEQMPRTERRTKFEAFRRQVVLDSLKKYNGHPPVLLQRAIEDQLNQENTEDKAVFAQLKEPLLGKWRISSQLDKLKGLGYFESFEDDKDVEDSLQKKFERLPFSVARREINAIKSKMIEDSLSKYHGKLPGPLLGKIMNNLYYQSVHDSLLLLKVGIKNADMEIFRDTAKIQSFAVGLAGDSQQLGYSRKEFKMLKAYDEAQLDSFLVMRLPKYKDAGSVVKWFTFNSIKQTLRLNSGDDDFDFNKTKDQSEVLKQMIHNMLQWSSLVMFAFMPLVAFLLVIFYFRLKRYYYEHLIFSIHIHSVLFFLVSIGLGCNLWLGWTSTIGWMMIAFFFYILIALRKVYGQGWFKTIFKFFMLSFVYLFFATIVFAFTAVYGFLTF